MIKSIRTILILSVTVVVVVFLLRKTRLIPSLSEMFSSRTIRVEETPMVVKDIQGLSQLITMTSYDEVSADSIRLGTTDMVVQFLPLPRGMVSPDRLVIVGKGKVVAGLNLASLGEHDINVTGDSVSIKLPPATILEVVMNPSDFSTFSEEGNWTPDAVTKVKLKAREKMVRRALNQGILPKAEARGKLLVENFLKVSGFKKVVFQ
jgi:hypothetical protein